MQKDKVTIITGGGRGIGRSIALRMAQETSIVLVGRTESDLVETCKIINDAGGSAKFSAFDITYSPHFSKLEIDIWNSGKTVLNLVANAAMMIDGGPIETIDEAQWRKVFDTNVNGTFNLIKQFLPTMKKNKKGSISVISSLAGIHGAKNHAAYSASKFALNGMVQSVAQECEKYNIPVVAICPGYVEGEATDKTIQKVMQYQGLSKEDATRLIAYRNHSGRIQNAEDVAEKVVRVAADGMKITGKAILVD